MNRSDTINDLAAALSKAQGELEGARKDSANPFFKSKYADLSSCWDACREALSRNQIAVVQCPRLKDEHVEVETMLAHASGQWVAESLEMPVSKADAQGVGSAITYARRYALCSMVGIAPEDDDGNAAAASVAKQKDKYVSILKTAARGGLDSLKKAFEAMSPEARKLCKPEVDALKAELAKESNHAATV